MEISRILLELQNMAQEEILPYIPEGKLEEIRNRDPHPLFKVFSIAHEGVSNGTIIGLGKTALRWLQNSIAKIYDKLKAGTKLFYDHKPGTNSHEGRTVVGEVISKAKKLIKGEIHTVAVTYIYPEFADKKMDVASFEGSVELPENLFDTPTIDPAGIGEITGIALGNSEEIQPAFKNAVLQGALQMMAEKGEKMTFEEVLKFVKENKVQPSDLYGEEILKEDSTVKNIIKAGNRDTYFQAKRLEDEKKAIKDTLEKEKQDLESKVKLLKTEKAKVEAGKVIVDIYKERKLDELTQKFINQKIEKGYQPEDPDNLKVDLNKFIDSQVEEIKKLQEAGIIAKSSNSENKETNGAGASDFKSSDGKDLEAVQAEL